MPDSETPESVLHAALQAAAADDAGAVFELIDEEDLPRWRRVTLSMLRHFERQPEAGRVFAEWGAQSVAELETLPDAQLFGRWLRASRLAARSRVVFGSAAPAPPAPGPVEPGQASPAGTGRPPGTP